MCQWLLSDRRSNYLHQDRQGLQGFLLIIYFKNQIKMPWNGGKCLWRLYEEQCQTRNILNFLEQRALGMYYLNDRFFLKNIESGSYKTAIMPLPFKIVKKLYLVWYKKCSWLFVITYQAEMKMSMTFTPELKNPSSPAFKSLKKEVENNLGRELKKNMPALSKVDVFQFRRKCCIMWASKCCTNIKKNLLVWLCFFDGMWGRY